MVFFCCSYVQTHLCWTPSSIRLFDGYCRPTFRKCIDLIPRVTVRPLTIYRHMLSRSLSFVPLSTIPTTHSCFTWTTNCVLAACLIDRARCQSLLCDNLTHLFTKKKTFLAM